ncbi:MAG: ribonuclease III [Robiginitomaculum sp.]|nr:MAG: ribonuclease III [Robiginitomaculum sp.]
MNETTLLQLPYIIEAQAQKHVTHNEAIRALDALIQLSVLDRNLANPPISPSEGDRYLVATSATGAWATKAGQVAAWQDGAWMFYAPALGWRCWVADEAVLLVHDGSVWQTLFAQSSGGSFLLNQSAAGAANSFAILEEELALIGAFTDSTIQIPDRAIVFAVSSRTTQAVTGAASYDCGLASDVSKYGGALSVLIGATNSGVTGSTAFYADTAIRISANGGSFTGGKVRIALHFALFGAPTS